ncbi:MAG: AAA family ATPase [Candidatus Heimdallarchaeota archaeon]|nr:AAA family ATPase [Candidatus Heimdallarchaeota archaeon]
MRNNTDLVKINLIKYIGLLKVHKKSLPNHINNVILFDVKIVKSGRGRFLLKHTTGSYELEPLNDILTINEIADEGFLDNIISITDLEIRSDHGKTTSVNEFNLRLSKIPKVPFSDSEKLFYSFRSALTRKIHVNKLRIQRQVPYQQNSPNNIELDEVIIGINTLSGNIGAHSVDLVKVDDQIWKLKKNQNIPKTGILTFIDPANNYEYDIFKYKKFRQVLNDPQIPSSPLGRIRSLLSDYNGVLEYADDFKFSSDHEMTKNQEEILNRLISDPLIIVDSVAGTGKTTTVVNAIIELIQQDKRILIIAHSHRVLEAIIEMLIAVNKKVEEDILRITTKNTRRKVIHKKFLAENIIALEKQIMVDNLNKALEIETNEKIREIQKNISEIIESDETFSSLITLSKKIVICTADSLLSQSYRFYKNSEEIQTFHPPTAEFDLAIIEDSSDINFPTLIHSCQFSHRWAFIGDMFQSAPVITKSQNVPKYQDRILPKGEKNIARVTDLINEKRRTLSINRSLGQIDHLLGTQALSMLKDKNYFDLENQVLNLTKWHRSTPELSKFIVNCFEILKGNIDFSNTAAKDIPVNLVEIIDSYSPKIAEEVNEGDLGGYTNTHEITLLINWLTEFLNKLNNNSGEQEEITIGIYSPFNIQIDHIIQGLVEEFPDFTENDRFIEDTSGNVKIHVNSLHNHKNREYDIMILSCTRSRIGGQLKDEKDMFTIFSRAKQSLVFCLDMPRFKASWGSIKNRLNRMQRRETGPWSYLFQYITDHPEIVM